MNRLKKRADFLRVARGRHTAAPGLVLQASRRPGSAGPPDGGDIGSVPPVEVRVGFTASRRVGNAVARNRARRRLRAVVQEILCDKGRPGFDYVIIARQGTLTRPYPALRNDLAGAIEVVHGSKQNGSKARTSSPKPRNRRQRTDKKRSNTPPTGGAQ